MHRAVSIAAAALLLLVPALALPQAPDFTFFGPKSYDHPAAGPSTAAESIAVPADVTGPFTLRIQNGAGDERVDAGWVYLNGAQIAAPEDLHPQVSQLERGVPLQVSNELTVLIRGRAGTRLSVSVSGRLVPPVPTGLAPDPLTVFAGATANVTATLAPVPRFAGALAVSTGNGGVATAPLSVAFAAGQAQVPIPVTGVARGGTILTVALNGVSVGSQINVVAPVVTSLSSDPLKLFESAKAIVVAALAPAPIVPGALTVATGNTAVATAPLSVPFAAGQTLVPIEVTGVTAGGTTLTATLNGASKTSQVVVLPPPPQIGSISPASAAAGAFVTLKGENFDAVPAGNLVTFPGPGGSAVPAAVIAANASQLTVRVPETAVPGPITLNNSRGTAQSPAFAPLPLNNRFTATRAGLTAPLTRLGTPVTPFVQGADPGDRFTFQLLGQPAKGTAFLVDNKLAYQATAAINDVDQFPYRATAADGSTRDGTDRVKAYNSGNLTRCTAISTLAQRINVQNCAFYGEVTTRTSATGLPVTVQYIAARPSSGASPKAAVFLIGGGDFDLNFAGNAATGQATLIGANFVVRTAQLFADAGYLAIAMNGPSDLPDPTVRTVVDSDLYRVSVRHAVDILMVLREVNTDSLDVFLAGTSRGAISAVATNLIGAGISLSSAVTRASTGPGPRFIGDPRHPNLQPDFVQRPSHVLWNTLDQCFVTVPADSQKLADDLGAAFDFVTGGLIADPTDPCGAQHFHGYYAIEPEAVGKITAWLDGRVAALAGNRRPDAAFALLVPTAPGVPLQIDLAALTGDADGDPLSYTLSHVGSGRGGTVTRNGAVLTYTPPEGATAGTDNFVYVVTDGRGGVNAAVIRMLIGG